MRFCSFISSILLLAAVSVPRAFCNPPQSVTARDGECLLAGDVRIVCSSADTKCAGVLQKEIFDRYGVIVPITDVRGDGGVISLERVPDIGSGGYLVDISVGGIICRASSDDGFRHAFKVLAALLQVRGDGFVARCAVVSYDPTEDASCRSFDDLYGKYKGAEGYTAVHVTGAALKNTGHSDLGISGIMTVCATGRSTALETDFLGVVNSGGYDMLLDNTAGDRRTVIYAKDYPGSGGRQKSEVLILSRTDKTEVVLIRGRLDIKRITSLPLTGQ